MKPYLKLRTVKSLTCLLQSRLPHNPSRTGLTYEPLVTVLHCARVRVDTLLSCLLQPHILYHTWQVLSRDFSFFLSHDAVCPAQIHACCLRPGQSWKKSDRKEHMMSCAGRLLLRLSGTEATRADMTEPDSVKKMNPYLHMI